MSTYFTLLIYFPNRVFYHFVSDLYPTTKNEFTCVIHIRTFLKAKCYDKGHGLEFFIPRVSINNSLRNNTNGGIPYKNKNPTLLKWGCRIQNPGNDLSSQNQRFKYFRRWNVLLLSSGWRSGSSAPLQSPGDKYPKK